MGIEDCSRKAAIRQCSFGTRETSRVRLDVCKAREFVVILLTSKRRRVDCAALMQSNTHALHLVTRNAGMRACNIGYRAARETVSCAPRSWVSCLDRIVSD